MNVRDIPINDVKIVENVRVKIANLSGLMNDIKSHGLYNPIKVAQTKSGDYILIQGNRRLAACKKLGWRKISASISDDIEMADLLIHNMAENVHREDINPVELGRVCILLKEEMDMTESEIATKLSITPVKVKSVINAYRGLPGKHRNRVAFVGHQGQRAGNIPASVALKVLATKRSYGLSESAVDKLLTIARRDDLGVTELAVINLLLQDGLTVAQAIEEQKNYKYLKAEVIVKNEEIESILAKYKMDSRIALIVAILYGELPPLKRPSWFKAKQVPVKA